MSTIKTEKGSETITKTYTDPWGFIYRYTLTDYGLFGSLNITCIGREPIILKTKSIEPIKGVENGTTRSCN